MSQEAYAMFPALAEMQARSRALNSGTDIEKQKWALAQQGMGIFGGTAGRGAPLPGTPAPQAPAPGQASVRIDPTGPAYGGATPAGVPGVRVPAPSAGAGGPPGGLSTISAEQQPAMQGLPGKASQMSGPAPAPGQPSAAPGGQPEVSLDSFMAAARKRFPNASNAALAQAATYYLPFMQEADQVRLKEAVASNSLEIAGARADATTQAAQARADATTEAARIRAAAMKETNDARIQAQTERANARIDLLKQTSAATIDLGNRKLAFLEQNAKTKQQLDQYKELRLQIATANAAQDVASRAISAATFLNDDDPVKASSIEAAIAQSDAAKQQLETLKQKLDALGKESSNTRSIPSRQVGALGAQPDINARRQRVGLPPLPGTQQGAIV